MKTLLYSITGLLLMLGNNLTAQSSETTDIQANLTDEGSILQLGVRYYYYPNLDTYFDSEQNVFVFESNTNKGQIVKAKEVPSGYRGYSLFNNVRVAITDYDGDEPFTKIGEHRKQFPKKYTSRRQPPKVKATDKNLAYN
jgi:hypothetical protein